MRLLRSLILRLPRGGTSWIISGSAGICLLSSAGCADTVAINGPPTDKAAQRWQLARISGPLLAEGPDCPEVQQCSTQLIGSEETCVCELTGIDVEVAGGEPPPPPPYWPDFPGYTWPDPEDVAAGYFPPPPPGGWGCDPNGLLGGCTWSASLRCPQDLPRGSYGTCIFEISPAESLEYISGWTFQGENVTRSVSSTATSWAGVLVESGTVRVDFRAAGADAMVVTNLSVAPRSTGIWTQPNWESKLEFVSGQGSQNCQLSTRPRNVAGERLGWTTSFSQAASCVGQQIEPASASGAPLAQGSGPNEGAWYVQNVSYYFKSTSQLHAGLSPGAAAFTLTNASQADACRTALGLPPGSPVSVNLYTFNATCASVSGWGGFLSAVWNHEEQHFLAARNVLQQPGRNIYLELEGIVATTEYGAASQVTQTYNQIQGALTGLGEPSGNWSTPFWLWVSESVNEFSLWASPSFNVVTRPEIAR